MLLSYEKTDGTLMQVRLKELPTYDPVSIGRGKDADVILDDPKSSRVNTKILYWDGIFVIRDMNSSNGTYLNEKRVDGVAKLVPGDVIRIGSTEIQTHSESTSADVTMRLDAVTRK